MIVALVCGAAAPARALERVPAIVHVHSSLSTGALSLEQLATVSQRDGIGALLVTENLLLRVEYGLAPFRALTHVSHEETSVAGRLDTYLARVGEARARVPGMIIVPGVEVVPHYYWTGSPFALEMGLHDTQKNLLVFGLNDARTLAAVPAIGNPASRIYTPQSLIDAAPVLLLPAGLLVLARPRVRRRRLGTAIVVFRQRRWWLGGVLIAIGVATIVRGWPFTVDPYPPWEDFRLDPHQAVIDYVNAHGGVSVWSFPEAPDSGERHVGPVTVRWRTDPYPDDLLRTAGYTAFGAVYEQPTKFANPGGLWDRILTQYATGERSRPVWAIGESGFHGSTAGKRLGPIQTVFFVTERSEAGILDAFKRGRMYAVRQSGGAKLALTELSATAAGASAGIGDSLTAPAGTPLEIRARIDAADNAAHTVRVTLVKNGEIAATWSGTTPFSIVHQDVVDRTRRAYRLDARVSAADYLLTNPVFVGP